MTGDPTACAGIIALRFRRFQTVTTATELSPRRPAAAPLVLLAGAAGTHGVVAPGFGSAAFDASVTAKRIVVDCSVAGALCRFLLRRPELRPPRPLCCGNPLPSG